MNEMTFWLKMAEICVPVIIALIPTISTIVSNRKKTQESVKEVKDMLQKHIKEDEEEKARAQRYRILRFYDEICDNRRHSESHYEDILDDIDEYEKYCDLHPTFRNNRGKAAMECIKDTYKKLKKNGGFLAHKEEE